MVHCNQPPSAKGQDQVRINNPLSQIDFSPGLSCQGAALTRPNVFLLVITSTPKSSSSGIVRTSVKVLAKLSQYLKAT